MQKIGRSIFFWLLVLSFVVICPLIILNSSGYRFDFSRGVFVYSGTLMLKTNPASPDIYLNNKLQESKRVNRINSSLSLTGLIPATYEIKVSAKEFQTWSKKTDIHSGLASEFWNILLIRNNYETTSYNTLGISKFFISPKDNLVATVSGNNDSLKVSVISISSKTILNDFSIDGWNFISEKSGENIEWDPQQNYLSIPIEKTVSAKEGAKGIQKTETAYFIANLSTGEKFDLEQFTGIQNISQVRWDPQEKGYLFFLSDNNLYRANINSKDEPQIITNSVSAFELSKNYVYYSQPSTGLVFRTSLLSASDKTQITDNFPRYSSPIKKIIVYDEQRMAFIDENKDLFIYNEGDYGKYFKKIGTLIEGMQFSNDGKKFLFWSRNEIFVYFLRDWNVQPIRSEDNLETISRYSDDLSHIQWFDDYEHIIFTVGDQIKIIELDPRDHRNSMNIVKAFPGNFSVYNYSNKKLFFTNKSSETTDLFSINFPERNTILGF